MYKFIFLILSILIVSFAEETNIYDPDSLVVLEILDSSGFSHDYFDDVIWVLVQENVNDSDWRICRLYLEAGDMQSLPPILPGKLNCLPSSIGNLYYLNFLEIPYHNLESIPDEINKLEHIKILDLRYNPLKEIQVEIAQCEMLSYIGLAHTNITSLPNEFLDLGLRPCNIAVDTMNGNIYPQGVIDLCGLKNFTLTEQQKLWADVSDYAEYEDKYCQQSNIDLPYEKYKSENISGIAVKVRGYSLQLTLEREGLLSLSLFDSRGRMVRAILDKKVVSKGIFTIQMDKNISSGIYFLRGTLADINFSRKIIIEGGI